MKVIYGVGRVKPALTNTVAAIGIFDGVHKGHQWLIRRMVASARRSGSTSLVITFHPHPVEVLHHKKISYLSSLAQRLEMIKALGVDITVVIKFTPRFAHLEPEDFVNRYLVKRLGVTKVYVGDDFRFGQNRSGDIDTFEQLGKKYGFELRHMFPVKNIAKKISSSWLRELIAGGRLREAARMLGRPVSVSGTVIHGAARGKKLGFPTANIKFDSGILPSQGVYIVSVELDGRKVSGMANVGHRPTFPNRKASMHLEVHMFDFKKNIYGQRLSVNFLKKIRDEIEFSSSGHLIAQIRKDERTAKKYFQRHTV